MIDCVAGCYTDFTHRRAAAGESWTCTCNVCSHGGTLDVKFILHYGEFFIHAVGRQVDPAGPEVNVAHRLLKNEAVKIVGSSSYALFTEESVTALDLPLGDVARLSEIIDDGRQVDARVVALRG